MDHQSPQAPENQNPEFELSLQNVKRIIASHLTRLETWEDFVRYLRIQFCRIYNIPLKSPILGEYTEYELLYEVLLRRFVDDKKHLQDFIDKENDVIGAILLSDEEWFKQKMGKGYNTLEIYRSGKVVDVSKNPHYKPPTVDDLPEGDYKL